MWHGYHLSIPFQPIPFHWAFRCAGSQRVAMDQSDLAAADNSSTVMKNYQHERTQGAETLRQVSPGKEWRSRGAVEQRPGGSS